VENTGLSIVKVDNPSDSEGDIVWLEAELEDDEQIGWLNNLVVEQGLTLYEVHKVKARLDEWFVGALTGISHRGEHI
jgi:ABC-2 type transport system ATP-binding protein